jgi:sterol desaturase/sphingolipid hydroxylase (fatty acid hydroxylase superfamily)
MIWQILFSMIIEDTCFYWSHRTLHSPKLYSKIHKKHHEFYTSVSYCSVYAHPLEYIFGDVIPVFVGSKILG